MNIRYYFITDRILNQEAYVEFSPTLDTIGNYFTKALQGSQFSRFQNIIIGIHEDEIQDYNASGRSLPEEQKLKLNKQKEESHNDAKLVGNQVNQGVCWEKSINGKSINGLVMHTERAHYGTFRKKCLYRTWVFRT